MVQRFPQQSHLRRHTQDRSLIEAYTLDVEKAWTYGIHGLIVSAVLASDRRIYALSARSAVGGKEAMSVGRKRPKVGDILEIPLSDGRRVFAQYVCWDDQNGCLIQVFDLIADETVEIEALRDAKALFPPVFTGLFAAVRLGLWRVIGHLPVEGFVYPMFLWPLYDGKAGQVRYWNLWDGRRRIPLGRKLPERYRKLEQLVVWAPQDVAERIETGHNPMDFRLDR